MNAQEGRNPVLVFFARRGACRFLSLPVSLTISIAALGDEVYRVFPGSFSGVPVEAFFLLYLTTQASIHEIEETVDSERYDGVLRPFKNEALSLADAGISDISRIIVVLPPSHVAPPILPVPGKYCRIPRSATRHRFPHTSLHTFLLSSIACPSLFVIVTSP
jgi:hypothetical protein